MGYTQFSVEKIEAIIREYRPLSVIDLGAQNMYNQPKLPAPYAMDWYLGQGIGYTSIDLNGEYFSLPYDLSKPIYLPQPYDMLVDCGTSEHVCDGSGNFSWDAIYNCWLNKFNLLKVGGVMYSENPKTRNWPGHGRQYYTEKFYLGLLSYSDLYMLELGTHPAMNNTADGWNVFCSMKKTGPKFPTLAQFKKLDLRTI